MDLEAADKAALVLWPGLCAIHARFHPGQIEAVRKADPSCKVIVHPECSPEVVRAADGAGSTTYIIEYVRNAPDGAHIYVGTEINLVERLAREQEGRIRVEALRSSACSNMAKITPEKLRATLEGIVAGNTDPITVPSEDSAPAKASLERMLEALLLRSPSLPRVFSLWGKRVAGVPLNIFQHSGCSIPNRFQGALPPPFLYAQNKVFSQKKAV